MIINDLMKIENNEKQCSFEAAMGNFFLVMKQPKCNTGTSVPHSALYLPRGKPKKARQGGARRVQPLPAVEMRHDSLSVAVAA